MNYVNEATPGQILLCETKPFSEVIKSSLVVILIIATLPISWLIIPLLLIFHYTSPNKIWVKDGYMHSDKLCDGPVNLADIEIRLINVRLLYFTVNRNLEVYRYANSKRERLFTLSQLYCGKENINNLILALALDETANNSSDQQKSVSCFNTLSAAMHVN